MAINNVPLTCFGMGKRGKAVTEKEAFRKKNQLGWGEGHRQGKIKAKAKRDYIFFNHNSYYLLTLF